VIEFALCFKICFS